MKKRSLCGVGFCIVLMVGLTSEVGAFDESDLEKLWKTNECSKCDLTGADLRGANLSKAKLTRANLSGADLTGADLRETRLFRANLIEANLTGADLGGANLLGAKLTGIQIDKKAISTNKLLIVWKKKEEVKKQAVELKEVAEKQLVKGVDAVANLTSTLDNLIVNFQELTVRLEKLEELFARLDKLEEAVGKLEANTKE